MSCIILLKTKTIPKTTSGKIARSWCRKAYIDGSLSILVKWDSDTKNLENGNENENGNVNIYENENENYDYNENENENGIHKNDDKK